MDNKAWDFIDQVIAAQQAGMTEAEKEEERRKDEEWIKTELEKNPTFIF